MCGRRTRPHADSDPHKVYDPRSDSGRKVYDDDDDNDRQDDVDRCVAMRLTAEQTNSYERLVDGEPTFDVTKFWFDPAIQAKMPLLCRVAIGVLSVPVSTLAVKESLVLQARFLKNGAAS